MPSNDATNLVWNETRSQSLEQPTEQPTSATVLPPDSTAEAFATGTTYRYGATAPPFAVSTPTPEVDQKAQQEATETAQALRYLASRDISRDYIETPRSHPQTLRKHVERQGDRALPSRAQPSQRKGYYRYGDTAYSYGSFYKCRKNRLIRLAMPCCGLCWRQPYEWASDSC